MNSAPEIAIHVANLSKEFKLYSRPSDMLLEILKGKPRYKSFWALRDVSFDIYRGQVVGLIGRNGAGKSTLLKIISGTLDKTGGELKVNGRISSILELGTGFSGEYTGRENVYLGGLMVGLSRDEIQEKEDWIIEFSELEDFIDQPFKTYSTGMQARLTFATAVCVDPDILIIDEALSVGDARFQLKSFRKIKEFRKDGRTILVVSHSTNTINEICDHAILLENGQILDQGRPEDITKIYWKLLFADQEGSDAKSPGTVSEPVQVDIEQDDQLESGLQKENGDQPGRQIQIDVKDFNPAHAKSSRELRGGSRKKGELIAFGILDQQGKQVTTLESGHKYTFYLRLLLHEDVEELGFGFHITNEKGVVMYGIDTNSAGLNLGPYRKGEIIDGQLHVTMWLANGNYFLSGGFGDTVDVIDFRYDAVLFSIPRLPWVQHATIVNLEPCFEIKTIESGALYFKEE